MSKSKIVNDFFSAYNRSKMLYKTDNLIGVFKFYPKVKSTDTIKKRIDNINERQKSLEKRLTRNLDEINISNMFNESQHQLSSTLDDKIRKQIEELRLITEETKNQQDIIMKKEEEYKKIINSVKNKVISLDKTVKITSPNFERTYGSSIYHTKQSVFGEDVIILDGTPINSMQLYQATLGLLHLYSTGDFIKMKEMSDVIMNHMNVSYHRTIMAQIQLMLYH